MDIGLKGPRLTDRRARVGEGTVNSAGTPPSSGASGRTGEVDRLRVGEAGTVSLYGGS